MARQDLGDGVLEDDVQVPRQEEFLQPANGIQHLRTAQAANDADIAKLLHGAPAGSGTGKGEIMGESRPETKPFQLCSQDDPLPRLAQPAPTVAPSRSARPGLGHPRAADAGADAVAATPSVGRQRLGAGAGTAGAVVAQAGPRSCRVAGLAGARGNPAPGAVLRAAVAVRGAAGAGERADRRQPA